MIGDVDRIRQVLLNLLSNAIKFTPSGGVRLEVRGCAEGIQFRVLDTGRGIPEPDQEKLFVAFEQVDARGDSKLGGAGLGLSISKKLVELMGGTLQASNREPGPGACFEFSLPLRVAPFEALAEVVPKPLAGGLRVLLCEDNAVNQRVTKHMLQRCGHTVDLAENGRLAVEKAQAFQYDVILMDCQMPEMDGFEATRQIRALAHACFTPVIALTASAYPEDVELCRQAGMTRHLAKPVVLEDLRVAIEAVANRC